MEELFGIEQICEILPHRYPFLLIDRVTEIIDSESIKGYKNISINEPVFQGHFPQEPVFPGVLILESMAQLGAVLILKRFPPEQRMAYFTGIDKVKFRRKVIPGDRMELEVKVIRDRVSVVQMEGSAKVDGEIAATAIMMAALKK